MKTAPRGAVIVSLYDWNGGNRQHTSFGPSDQHHLAQRLGRFAELRRALNEWDSEHGRGDMPQPQTFGIPLGDLKPSQIAWPAPRTQAPEPEAHGRAGGGR